MTPQQRTVLVAIADTSSEDAARRRAHYQDASIRRGRFLDIVDVLITDRLVYRDGYLGLKLTADGLVALSQ